MAELGIVGISVLVLIVLVFVFWLIKAKYHGKDYWGKKTATP